MLWCCISCRRLAGRYGLDFRNCQQMFQVVCQQLAQVFADLFMLEVESRSHSVACIAGHWIGPPQNLACKAG